MPNTDKQVFKDETLATTIPMTVQVNVEVDPSFVEFLLDYPDVFGLDYIGYWGRGLRLRGRRGWLVVEYESLEDELGPMDDDLIVVRFERGDKEVCDFCHFMGEQQVVEIIKKGVANIGTDFQESYDGDSLDLAIQQALLGSHTYA